MVSGMETELLGITATNGPAKLQLILIPGNPGSAHYYALHLRLLFQAMSGQVDVMAITHAGHDPKLNGIDSGKLWSIEDQIQHKIDFMKQYMLLPGRPPVVVLGHSIGAFVAVHAVTRMETSLHPWTAVNTHPTMGPSIVKVFAMTPFLWIDPASWQIRLHRLAAAGYEAMGAVAGLLCLLPVHMRLAVVRGISGGMDEAAEQLTQQLLKQSSVRNNFYMAHTEYKLLAQPPPSELLRGLGRRLHVFGCPKDYWMSRDQYQELQEQVQGLQARWIESISHAYCTSFQECQHITDIIADILCSELLQQASMQSVEKAEV